MSTKSKSNNIKQKAALDSIIASFVCIIGGLLVGMVVLLALSIVYPSIPASEAVRGIQIVLAGPLSSGNVRSILFNFGDMLLETTPLMMTGLSVAIAFKTGLFNIGAPGQYLMGAMSSLLIALSFPKPESAIAAFGIWLLAFLSGAILGALWGSIPGLLKAVFNINEVIVCIMTNWIAANIVSWVFYSTGERFINSAEVKTQFIRKTFTNNIETAKFGLDKVFPGSNIDISIFITIIIAIIVYIILEKTTFGYELKACGYNKNASKYAGMSEKRNIVYSMAIAGALAGIGSSLWFLNGQNEFLWNTYLTLPSEGFNGIPCALLASNNPIGVIFTSIFLRWIERGGFNLSGYSDYNEYVSALIIAVIIYFSGFSKYIKDKLSQKRTEKIIKEGNE